MNRTLMRMVLLVAMTGAGVAKAEMAYIVEVTDFLKQNTRQAMTTAELKELKKTIFAESRVFAKAMELAKKEWDAAEKGEPAEKPKPGEKVEKPVMLAPTPFPASMISPRKYREMGTFTDTEKAQRKLAQIEEAEANQAAKDAKKNPNKAKTAHDTERMLAAQRAVLTVQEKIDTLIKNPAAANAPAAEKAPAAAPGAAAAGGAVPKK
ncbi:MAG: hypothetical protein ACOYOU_02370 [Kiritimatiellia bacterium]